jgi:hypothetical protein
MWWGKFLLLLTMTIGLTAVIVWVDTWIKRKRETHPLIFKNRSAFHVLVYVLLNL